MFFTDLHTTWIELNKEALIHNVQSFKGLIGNRYLAPVIKSNAYGHGLLEIASVLNTLNVVDYLCVFNLSDAIRLKQKGITKPILVLGTIDTDPYPWINETISYLVGDLVTMDCLAAVAHKAKTRCSIHLKIETGLSRFGFSPASIHEHLESIATNEHIVVTGIASHLAEAEVVDSSITLNQLQRFEQTVTHCLTRLTEVKYVHIGNSAAAVLYPLEFSNMFRVGIGIYGYWPSLPPELEQELQAQYKLRPVLTWKTRVAAIQKIGPQQGVGYKHMYITTKPTTIAVLPVGYHDGYHLALSNQSHVRINGRLAPTRGRIAMNTIMVDITDIPDVQVGTEVSLIDDTPSITARALAEYTPFHNGRYITTTLHPKIPRIVV